MKLENEDALDNLILCEQCFTLHEELPLKDGTTACCSSCGAVLYRYDSKLIDHGLALSVTGIVFFILANLFPLVQIEILGHGQFITVPKTIFSLFEYGFYFVGILCTFLIFIFPFMVFTISMLLFILLKMKRGKQLTKELLVLLAHVKPWSMTDIFLISILVALVKLIGYAQIHMGIAFWALMIFVLIDLYIVKRMHLFDLWMLRKRILFKEDTK